jgi:hypothetical protein
MTKLNTHTRDEFLRALEEARRAAMADDEPPHPGGKAATAAGTIEFRRALEGMAGRVRSYISTTLLAGLYAEATPRATPKEPAPPPSPPKSDHETVVDELHLTPGLTAEDLKHLRRKFAKVNHPDRVSAARRDQATRRMTIANSLIDEALRGRKTRVR